ILDATTLQVSDQLATAYPGSGGSRKASGVKVQLEYDLLSGQFLSLSKTLIFDNSIKSYCRSCSITTQPPINSPI
ncbi:IS4 family transposase, partial [Bacillus cereus]